MKEPDYVTMAAARLARAYPHLAPYAAARLAVDLCAVERAARRDSERSCSYSDYDVERGERLVRNKLDRWFKLFSQWADGAEPPTITLHGDPRGAVMYARFNGEREAVAV